MRRPWFLAGGNSGTAKSANDGMLTVEAGAAGSDKFTVNYDLPPPEYFAFWPMPMDEKGLSYTSAALGQPLKLIGYPVIHIEIAADRPDADVFAYLEQVAADGKAEVIAFGRLKISHRRLGKAPYDTMGLPWHSGLSTDVAPLPVGAKAMLDFALTPVSRIVPVGSRLRVTVAGADPRQRNLQDIKQTPPPVLTVFRGGKTGSRIDSAGGALNFNRTQNRKSFRRGKMFELTGRVGRKTLLSATCAIAALAMPDIASAQDKLQASPGDAEIIVTGSRVRGTAPVGSAITTLDTQDIAQSGRVTLDRAIKELPQVFDLGVSENSRGQSGGSGNIVYGNSINLRGIGPSATLILVDGHRVTNNGRSTDPSILPSLGVQRVEIVADGASAIYGSGRRRRRGEPHPAPQSQRRGGLRARWPDQRQRLSRIFRRHRGRKGLGSWPDHARL